jgi:hypothetical protein
MSWPLQDDGELDNTRYFDDCIESLQPEPVHLETGNSSFWPNHPYLDGEHSADISWKMRDQEHLLRAIYASPARANDLALAPAWYGTPSAAGTFTLSSTNLVTC